MLKTSLALAIGLSSSLAFAQSAITVEDIPKVKSVIQTSISPDGESVAFTRSLPRKLYVDENGSNYSELYVVDDEGVERHLLPARLILKAYNGQTTAKQFTF